ncbi:hypothetical protein BY458DRAFT_532007 [Sporodiniella umbellata]|nr:hypothetical protein BY458DRAFT_532007 [Sporodiniella umbellata]
METENPSGRDPKVPNSTFSPVTSSRQSMDLIEGTSYHFQQANSAHAQRQRWDAFFDPQYTFTAFIHQLDKRDDDCLKREHQKNVDHLVDTSSFGINSINSSKRQSCDVILSNPSSLLPSPKETKPVLTWTEQDQDKLIHRLEILKDIRASMQTEENVNSKDILGRWKQSIAMKAQKLCQEACVTNDDGESKSFIASVYGADEEKQVQQVEEAEVKKGIKNCRRSFLLFVFGFVFPPLWLFGSIYFASYENNQTAANRRLDIFVTNPSSIGFRHSE